MASYTNPNLVDNGTNINEPAAVTFSLMSGLASYMKIFHQSKSPSRNTILQGHHCCIPDFATLKMIMISL